MNFIKKHFLFILSLIFVSIGCQKEKKEVNMQNSLRVDFQEGDLPSLHPHDLMIYLRGISIGKTLYEGLTRIQENGKAKLAGAQSVEVSPNGLTYTFKLRKNHWSDGTPVTAFQYEAGWKEALLPISFCSRPDLLYMIKNASEVKKGTLPVESLGVKALDAETLRVDLARPSPHFLELLAQPICAPLQNPSDRSLKAFNGPFLIDKWERNASLVLKPNPHFWNRKQITLDQIKIDMIQDTETAFALFEKNQLDWVGVPLCPLSSEQIEHLQAKNKLLSSPIDRVFWVFLNTKHNHLSSPSIRKALSLAINRETITNNVFVGNRPLVKPIPHALLPLPSTHSLKEDLIEAKKLFAQGLEELGLTKENFPPLIITYSQQASRKQMAEYLQDAWTRSLGIQVRLEPQEWNTLRANLGTGQFEISGCFEASFYHDPLEMLERVAFLNPGNFAQWAFLPYQQKISSASHEVNPEKRMQLLSEAEEILMDQMPFIPISSDKFLFSHPPQLKGYIFDSVGAIDFSYASMK
jgi:oligopeptide transport system substrate-binding protein